jgi:uncharacterized alpha-E superfamily protein
VLSRIAEQLFWIGRYLERADVTARILDVHLHQVLEDPTVDPAAAAVALLAVMGIHHPTSDAAEPDDRPTGGAGTAPGAGRTRRPADTLRPSDAAGPAGGEPPDAGPVPVAVTELLALDPHAPSSIAASLTAAREAARHVREVISSELWECLNATYLGLGMQANRARTLGLHGYFQWVRQRAAMATGIVESTLSRDDGWQFLVLGRSLERLDMTARLLASRLVVAEEASGDDTADWVATLRSCSAHEAYLRSYRRGVEGPLAIEFLLLDRLFPRSAWRSLAEAEACVAALLPTSGRLGPDDPARRALGLARATLELRSPRDLLDELPSVLQTLEAACAEATVALGTRFFRHEPTLAWRPERAGTVA